MHPVETAVCCDHTSPTGECGRWGCRYMHVGLQSDRGASGGKEDGAGAKDEANGDEGMKEPKGQGKDEEVTEGNAGSVAASSSSPATTTSLSSTLSFFPSSSLSSFSSSSSPSPPRSCHYQSSSAAGRHTDGAIGPSLQVLSTSSFSSFLPPSSSGKSRVMLPPGNLPSPSLPPSLPPSRPFLSPLAFSACPVTWSLAAASVFTSTTTSAKPAPAVNFCT